MALHYYSENEDNYKEESIDKYKDIFIEYEDNIPNLSEALNQMFISSGCTEEQSNELINDLMLKIDKIMKENKNKIKSKYQNLKEEEIKIISSYTCEAKDKKYSPYKLLNKNLVSDNRQEGINNISKYLYILLKSLRKLDKYIPQDKSKFLYRCINSKVEINKNIFKPKLIPYIVGNKKTFWGFTSTSPDVITSYNFLKEGDNYKSGTIFTITGKVWGYDITLFNYYKENEILLEPERQYVIDEVLPPINDIIHIRCDIQETSLVLKEDIFIEKDDFDNSNYTTFEDDFAERIKERGKIQLIVFENFKNKYDIKSDIMIDIITYNKENEILYIFDNNIEHNKYFNVVFFNYDNKEDAFDFLKTFIEKAMEDYTIYNSEYPCFIFFKNKNFNKEILYSYYLEKTKEMKISSYYDLKSHNIYFINDQKSDIKKLLSMDIINYFYGYDLQGKDDQSHKIRILFFGQARSGKSTFINYLLGKQKIFCSSNQSLQTKGGEYTHSKYPILMKDTKGFEKYLFDSQYKFKKIIDDNIIHIVFYLIPGPFNSNRDLDYSNIGSLIKFEEYHIHYYIIMTKDHEENRHFAITSFRFLNNIIINKDFQRIKTDLEEEKLIEYLERIKNKLKLRTFSIDTSKRVSKTIDSLLKTVYDDLLIEKENNEKFISYKLEKKNSNIKFNFSSSSIKDENIVFKLPSYILEQSAFLIKNI